MNTNRLILRPFIADDVQFVDWFRDPMVMRFTPSGPDSRIEQTAARIAKYRLHRVLRNSNW
jgi:[ribosomal protein S5]-alanine N-acetyltransferase